MRARHPIRIARSSSRRGFTLIELLTSIGIIAIITGITVISFAVVAKDARLSLARNTVTAALDNGRSLAIKDRKMVMVVFRQRKRGEEQYVEIIATRWSGDTYQNATSGYVVQYDRFVPIQDAAARELPAGIGIATAEYGVGSEGDFRWVTQGDLEKGAALAQLPQDWTEATGAVIGVMYGPDGTVLTRNTKTDTSFAFVDFNADGYQQWRDGLNMLNYANGQPTPPGDPGGPEWEGIGWMQRVEEDERFITLAPFIAVYDRDEAEEHRTGDWSNTVYYHDDLLGSLSRPEEASGFISLYGDRVHFNRFTGVVMR